MSSQSKEIKEFGKTIEEMNNKINSLDVETSKTKGPKTPSLFRLIEVIGIAAFVFFFFSSIIGFWDSIQTSIFAFLTSFDSNVKWPVAYMVTSFIYAFLLYYNFFVYGIYQSIVYGFQKSLENFTESLKKWQLWFILPLAVFVIVDVSFLSTSTSTESAIDEVFYGAGESSEEGESFFNKQIQKIMCSLDAECIRQQQNQEDSQQVSSVKYNIKITSGLPSYRESQFESREYPINLEIQSNNGKLYLDKLECYNGVPFEENLIDTKNLNHQEITHETSEIVSGISCDLSSLQVDESEDITISPVLYYTLEQEYTQEIPLVDFEMYNQEQGQEFSVSQIKSKVEVPSPQNTLQEALEISRSMNPQLPLIINGPQSTSYETYFMDLTFEKSNSNLGKINSTTLLEVQYPQNQFQFTRTIPYEITAYDGITSLPLEFNLLTSTLNSQGSSVVTYPIKMKFENKMVKDDQRITFTLIDDVN